MFSLNRRYFYSRKADCRTPCDWDQPNQYRLHEEHPSFPYWSLNRRKFISDYFLNLLRFQDITCRNSLSFFKWKLDVKRETVMILHTILHVNLLCIKKNLCNLNSVLRNSWRKLYNKQGLFFCTCQCAIDMFMGCMVHKSVTYSGTSELWLSSMRFGRRGLWK